MASLPEPFYAIGEAIMRIVKNKRRSMAMLSGIILGTLIITSVFIYIDVLEKQNYESVVREIAYETSFTLNEPGTEDQLWEIAEQISDDERVESSTVFTGGIPGGGVEQWGDDWQVVRLKAAIEGDIEVIQPDGDGSNMGTDINPVFVNETFTSTSIYDKLIGDRIEGSFPSSGESNGTVIPRSTAIRMNLVVGDVLNAINISLFSQKEEITVQVRFENVTVSAIYEGLDSVDPFSEEGAAETIYFNTKMLGADSELRRAFEDLNRFTLAVKINKDEFNMEDLDALSGQIDRLVNDITRESNDLVKGTNNIGFILAIFGYLSYALIFFDFVLVAPIVILSIYLLVFGMELSLEERKKEIGILKVQGANGKQIFRMLRNESFLIFAFGLGLGYIFAIFGAWVISSSVGFMSFKFSMDYFWEFVAFDYVAFLIAFVLIGAIVFFSVRKKGRRFIDLQVSEAVQTMEWKKDGIMRRSKLDVILFAFGSIGAIKTILDQGFGINSIGGQDLSLGMCWDTICFGFVGTIAMWVGGAFSAPVIAKLVAQKLEKLMLKLNFFKDIGPIIKSGLARRGDVARLIFIIALTLSVATLAVTQGHSDERFSIRELEYRIGADFHVAFTNESDHTTQLMSLDGVDRAMSLPSITVEILNVATTIVGIDAENASFAKWHYDSFADVSPSEALDKLSSDRQLPGIYLGSGIAGNIGAAEGEIVTLKFTGVNPSTGEPTKERLDVKVLGEFDHAPGERADGIPQ